jgi:RHS repeat-associated protein
MLLAPATVIEVSGGLSRTTSTTYEAAGRTKAIAVAETGGVDVAVPTVTTGYSPTTGLPVTVSSSAGTVTTGYDVLGRVISQSDGTGVNTATTTYDIDSRALTVTDAKGTTTYTYDSGGEHRGLLTALDVGLGSGLPSAYTNLVYDAAGALTSFTFPNGVVQADVIDPAGNLTARGYKDSAGTPVAGWTRGYTVHGQVATESGPAAPGARAQSDSYDTAGRLTQVSDLIGAVCTVRKYAFTADSARTGLSTWTGAGDGTCPTTTVGAESSKRVGTVNSYDQLTATTVTGTGAGSGTYGYDALGRVTTLPAVDVPGADTTHNLTLGYFANDLAATQTQGTTIRTYTLDAANRLGSWVDTAGTTSTTTVNHYDDTSDSPTWTDTGTGTWTRQTASPAGVLGIIATGTTGAGTASSAAVQLVNPHGDIAATIPDTTAVTATTLGALNDTDEYGNTLTTGAPVYGWVGGKNRITDTTTGLTQMGVRLFNPLTARFGSIDPVFGGNDNPYGYPTDPLVRYDLDGQMADGPRVTPEQLKAKYPTLSWKEAEEWAKSQNGHHADQKIVRAANQKRITEEKAQGVRNGPKRAGYNRRPPRGSARLSNRALILGFILEYVWGSIYAPHGVYYVSGGAVTCEYFTGRCWESMA